MPAYHGLVWGGERNAGRKAIVGRENVVPPSADLYYRHGFCSKQEQEALVDRAIAQRAKAVDGYRAVSMPQTAGATQSFLLLLSHVVFTESDREKARQNTLSDQAQLVE